MKVLSRVGVLLSLLGAVLLLPLRAAADTCSGQWIGDFRAGDLNGDVSSLIVHNDALYVTGNFAAANGVRASGFARWQDGQWHGMDPDNVAYGWGFFELNGQLHGIGHFYDFETDDFVDSAALWSGGKWSVVPALKNYDLSGESVIFQGDLYLSGQRNQWPFAGVVLRFDGAGVHELPLIGYRVHALEVFQGQLYADVARSGDPGELDGLVRWNGIAWESTGWERDGARALTVHNGLLYASTNSKDDDSGLYAYDGKTWTRVPMDFGERGLISTLISTPQGLVAVDGFREINGDPISGVALWDGANWSAVGNGLAWHASDLVMYHGQWIVGGSISRSSVQRVNAIAVLNDDRWQPLTGMGNGITSDPYSATAHQGLLVVGDYSYSYGEAMSGINAWNGHDWVALNSKADYAAGRVHDWNGQLIASLSVPTSHGGWTHFSTCRWNGSDWIPIWPGVVIGAGQWLSLGQAIVATGYVNLDNTIYGAAIWRDNVWTAIAEPELAGKIGVALEFNGAVVVMGYFESIGGVPANFVAQWRDDQWSALGQGLTSNPTVGCVYRSSLYASMGNSLYVLENDSWRLLAELPDLITDLVVYDGRLYIAMVSGYDDLSPSNTLWFYDGTVLMDVVDSPRQMVRDLIVVDHGSGPILTVFGDFSFIGDRPASRIAQYTTCPCPADTNDDNSVDGRDLSVFLSHFSRRVDNPYEAPDFNGDREVDARDLSYLLGRFGNSCP